MDMSGHNHGSMSMGGLSSFLATNTDIAHIFWYLVAATCATRGCRTLVDIIRNTWAKRQHKTNARTAVPSKPSNVISQTYDTSLTMFRELCYPTMQPFTGRLTRYLTPPPLGHCLFILAFWMVLLVMLWTNTILTPSSSQYAYRWEKPAFRAGWVSVSQIPLLYALSCKINIVSILTGVSYERLNWLHRWVARTLFLTVIVHWAYFFHEWYIADFVDSQFRMMPMVKYGFGAWAVLGWSVLAGFGYFRHLCYELWLLQHLASAGLLLWLLYIHVPVYARYNIWMAIAFVAFDRIFRGIWSVVRNLHVKALGKGGLGFKADVVALKEGYLKLAVKDVDFNWRPGQHVFLSMPTCGIFESHPFTIANNSKGAGPQDLDVILKCHSGFTKRLRTSAERKQEQSTSFSSHRIFLSGPWGIPPLAAIERSNSLVFIASSTGASYNVPLLEYAVEKAPFVQSVHFFWIVRHSSQIPWFETRLRSAIRKLSDLGVNNITFRIFITTFDVTLEPKQTQLPSEKITHTPAAEVSVDSILQESEPSFDDHKPNLKEKDIVETVKTKSNASTSSSSSASQSLKAEAQLSISLGRPESFDPLIRPAVEAAHGETMVIACGGKSLMAQVRTYVANLSDERAVHKGTGAQGIYFWGETYGW